MAKLFTIADEFRSLFDDFDSINEEFAGDEDVLQGWFDTLEGIEGEFTAKAESVAQHIKEMKVEADAIDAEIKILQDRKKHAKAGADRLTEYLRICMDNMRLDKVETARCKISFRNNPESVQFESDQTKNELLEWAKLHEKNSILRFKEPELNLTEIKDAIKNGFEFPGVTLGRTRSLTIK